MNKPVKKADEKSKSTEHLEKRLTLQRIEELT